MALSADLHMQCYVRACMCVHWCVRMHRYYTSARVRACMHVCVSTLFVCIRECVCACVRARVSVFVCTHVRE